MIGLAPPFDAGRDADAVVGPQAQQIGVRHLEVPQGQRGAGLAGCLDHEAVDRGLAVGRAVADRGRVDAAAIERIIGVGRGLVDRLLQQRVGEILLRVLGRGPGVEAGRFPVEIADAAAQAAQETILVIGHVDLARSHVDITERGDLHRQALGRDHRKIEAGQAVGRSDRAERVPIGIGRYGDRDVGERAGRADRRTGLAAIEADLAEEGQGVRQFIVDVGEDVDALDRGLGGQVVEGCRRIEAQVGIRARHFRRAIAVIIAGVGCARSDAATGIGAGLDVELARAVGEGSAVAGERLVEEIGAAAGADDAEGAPGRAGAGAVPGRDIGEGGASDIAAPIDAGGIILVAEIEFRFLGIAAEDRDIAAAFVEVEPDQAIGGKFAQIGAFRAAILDVELGALVIGLEHIVDDAGDRVRAIERRRAVAQHFDALDIADGNSVGVVAEGRDAGIDDAGDRLRCRVQHGATAVDQQQRIALAQTTQRNGRYVAARGVGVAAAQHLFVEGDAAQLRDGAIEVGTRNGGHCLDLLFSDQADRQRAGGIGALDLGTDDDDFRSGRFTGLRGGFCAGLGLGHAGRQRPETGTG